MNIKEFTNQIEPIANLVAFKWVLPQSSCGLILSNDYHKESIRPGHVYVGEVIATGKDVKNFTIGDRFLTHEYAIKYFYGMWEADKVYYVEEQEILAHVPKDYVGMIIRETHEK